MWHKRTYQESLDQTDIIPTKVQSALLRSGFPAMIDSDQGVNSRDGSNVAFMLLGLAERISLSGSDFAKRLESFLPGKTGFSRSSDG